jgi:heptosyltransferase I
MRIAIVKVSALGDIVHAMIVLQFIKKYNKEILIDWIVEEAYEELLKFHPEINYLHVINLRKAKNKKSVLLMLAELVKLCKLDSYDIVIDMQGLLKSAIIARLIPSKKTIGFDKNSIREKSASLFYSEKFKFSYSKNVIERNIKLLEFALGLSINEKQIQQKLPFLFSSKRQLDFELSLVENNILLIPGASYNSKCYPVSKLAKLTTLMNANFLILWGNQKEKILANKIKELSPNVNVCNKLSIDSLILLISKVDLVIGSDTGPTHMALALNIPSITLFGPTPGYRNTLKTELNKVIESDSIVNPEKINKEDNSIKNISVQEIINQAQTLLESRN